MHSEKTSFLGKTSYVITQPCLFLIVLSCTPYNSHTTPLTGFYQSKKISGEDWQGGRCILGWDPEKQETPEQVCCCNKLSGLLNLHQTSLPRNQNVTYLMYFDMKEIVNMRFDCQ